MGLSHVFRRLRGIGAPPQPPAPDQDKPADPQPPIAGDTSWVPGDLAECIVSGSWWQVAAPGILIPVSGPALGDVLKVVDVCLRMHPQPGMQAVFLRFSAFPAPYIATCFRKIVPVADAAERADPAFIEDLRRALPAPAPVEAPAETVPA